jgi:streptogramin lyase
MRCRALLGTIAVGVLLAAAEPGGAAVVARLPAADGFSSLAATSTGAVWATRTEPGGKVGIGQLTPSGFAWRSVRTKLPELNEIHARPDGGIWALVGGNAAFRSNPDGTLTRVTVIPGAGSFLGTATVAPDGALDVGVGASIIVRLGLDGTRTVRHYKAPGDTENCIVDSLAAAQDGTLWLGWFGCSYVLRLAPDGGISNVPALDGAAVDTLAVGTDGTVWGKASPLEPRLFKVTPAGQVVDVGSPATAGSDLAAAPDGTAWLNDPESCSMLHLTGTTTTSLRAPIAPVASAVGPDGTLWLADRTQLLHLSPAELTSTAPCDTTDPKLSVPGAAHDRITLRALRRAGGLRVRSSEAGAVSGYVRLVGTRRKLGVVDRAIGTRGVVVTFSKATLDLLARRLADGRRVRLELQLTIIDDSGHAVQTAGRTISVTG